VQGFSARYDAALRLAATAHRAQKRKGSDAPYIVHPVQVSTILLRYGFAEDEVIAGLLHDVVEDQGVSLDSIEAEFGPAVAAMVAALSERKREGDRQRPWEERKKEALARLRQAGAGAMAVKAADVLHNAHSLMADLKGHGAAAWDHYSRGPEQTLWYYRSVLEIVETELGGHPLLDEVAAAVGDLERVIRQMGAR